MSTCVVPLLLLPTRQDQDNRLDTSGVRTRRRIIDLVRIELQRLMRRVAAQQ